MSTQGVKHHLCVCLFYNFSNIRNKMNGYIYIYMNVPVLLCSLIFMFQYFSCSSTLAFPYFYVPVLYVPVLLCYLIFMFQYSCVPLFLCSSPFMLLYSCVSLFLYSSTFFVLVLLCSLILMFHYFLCSGTFMSVPVLLCSFTFIFP